MKRFWTAPAVALFGLGLLAGCNDYNNTVQYNTGATITNISPSSLPAGTPSGTLPNCPNTPTGQTNPCFTLYVVGSAVNGFQSSTLVQWNNGRLPACTTSTGAANATATNGCSTFIDSTDMSAAIPYSFIAKPGTIYVNTWTPQSGTGNNGLSNALSFIIYGDPNPFPVLTAISPGTANYCAYSSPSTCPSVSITLTGTGFMATTQNGGSSVTFTGKSATNSTETAISTTFVSSTQLKATVPGTYLCATEPVQINVRNPQSTICVVNCPNVGGGDTNCDPSIPEPSNCTASTQTITISGASANTCPPPSPPNPNPTVKVAEETPAVSQDGRFVAYTSTENEISQILLRDTCVGATTECLSSTQTVSVNAEGALGNADSHDVAMTSDGRYVAFSSAANNLVPSSPTGRQIYLRDTCQGATGACKPSTTLISVDEEGQLAGTEAILPSISTSGRFVAFLAITPTHSAASAQGKPAISANSGLRQVFVRDTCLATPNCTPRTTRISLQPGDSPAGSGKPAGPALAGLARQIALSGGKSSTVFTPTVPIDDRVFLAIRNP